MADFLCRKRSTWARKTIASFILLAFFFNTITPAGAQVLPLASTSAALSVGFQPPVLLGLKIHPENPLLFDFIVDQGEVKLSPEELKSETEKLVKYFLAALTIPDKEVWVNLSPTEKDRIIPDVLGSTTMGKTMLEQDYVLKQMAASLTNPETDLGKKYWGEINKSSSLRGRPVRAEEAISKDQMTSPPEAGNDSFTKVWIMPKNAEVLESQGIVVIREKRLKVMMQEDHEKDSVIASRKAAKQSVSTEIAASPTAPRNDATSVSSSVFRTTILPKIEKEVNEGKQFADVRQIYNSVILAAWYKKALKESLLGKVYADKGKVAGVENNDKDMKQRIYEQYLEAFKKGAYNLIKEEQDASGELIPRKYFSGGIADLSSVVSSSSVTRNQLNQQMAGNLQNSTGVFQAGIWLGSEKSELDALNEKLTAASAVEPSYEEALETLRSTGDMDNLDTIIAKVLIDRWLGNANSAIITINVLLTIANKPNDFQLASLKEARKLLIENQTYWELVMRDTPESVTPEQDQLLAAIKAGIKKLNLAIGKNAAASAVNLPPRRATPVATSTTPGLSDLEISKAIKGWDGAVDRFAKILKDRGDELQVDRLAMTTSLGEGQVTFGLFTISRNKEDFTSVTMLTTAAEGQHPSAAKIIISADSKKTSFSEAEKQSFSRLQRIITTTIIKDLDLSGNWEYSDTDFDEENVSAKNHFLLFEHIKAHQRYALTEQKIKDYSGVRITLLTKSYDDNSKRWNIVYTLRSGPEGLTLERLNLSTFQKDFIDKVENGFYVDKRFAIRAATDGTIMIINTSPDEITLVAGSAVGELTKFVIANGISSDFKAFIDGLRATGDLEQDLERAPSFGPLLAQIYREKKESDPNPNKDFFIEKMAVSMALASHIEKEKEWRLIDELRLAIANPNARAAFQNFLIEYNKSLYALDTDQLHAALGQTSPEIAAALKESFLETSALFEMDAVIEFTGVLRETAIKSDIDISELKNITLASSALQSDVEIAAGLAANILGLGPDARSEFGGIADDVLSRKGAFAGAQNNAEFSTAIGNTTGVRRALKDTFDLLAGSQQRNEYVRNDFATILGMTMASLMTSSSSLIEPGVYSAPSVTQGGYGGIDFDPTNMNLQIKRDGQGVPLPLPQQNIEQINIEGLFPVIINIIPITTQNLPIFLGLAPKEPGREPELAANTAG